MEDLNNYTRTYKLEIENELRISMDEQPCSVELTHGRAEIFGTEMEIHKKYDFPPFSSIAVFTWHSCRVQVTGKPEYANIATDTYMILNVVLHASLEEHRTLADFKDGRGPITLVVGPLSAGKTTLCKYLLNYAARLGNRPVFVDLDVGQNSISITGTMGFCTVDKPADIVTGFEDNAAQVFQFGYKSPGHRIALYFLLLRKMAQEVLSGLRTARSKGSGVVINSCGWVRGQGYDAITLAAMAFEIDFLCVIDEERLYSQLLRDMPASVKVHYIPKMTGVVERRRSARSSARALRVREYFYGVSSQLTPFSFEIVFSEIQIFKVLSQPVPEDMDSMNITSSFINLQPVSLNLQLVSEILALSSAETVSDDVMLTYIIGFICVQHVDMARGVITVMAPQPSPLPSKILLLGDIRMEN